MRSYRGVFELAVNVLIVAMVVLVAALARMGGGSPSPAWAQVTSCGNGFLDPGEQCDPPGSLTCPDPGSPAGAFLPCSPTCQCPAPTSCGNAFVDPGEECDPAGSLTCPPFYPGGLNQACIADCSCPPVCVTQSENTSPACGNSLDDDCDQLIDCADPDCTGIFPCPPAKKDPTLIRFGRPGSPDRLGGHAKLEMAPVDLKAMPVRVLLTNPSGAIYSGGLPAGALTGNSKGTIFRFQNAGARTSGGISSVKIKKNNDGTYTFSFTTYANLSAATDAHMRLQFYIGDDPNAARDGRVFITLNMPWTATAHGWRAPKDH